MTKQSTSFWRDTLSFFESELFQRVQSQALFADSKTFADASPKTDWATVEANYMKARHASGFSLTTFVEDNFILPSPVELTSSTRFSNAQDYIEHMWDVLSQSPDNNSVSSLIPMPHAYIVPGGRFREIYYWDSYFTSLGLMVSGRMDLVLSMLENFLAIQQEVGCIPNGNRAYYITRSQPPILGLLYQLVASKELDESFHIRCREGIKREYEFWMDGADTVGADEAKRRVVGMPDGSLLNRYFDDATTPRPESYLEDIESASDIEDKPLFYQDLRAACESGWDFSSRWFNGGSSLKEVCTSQIVPVDLNALLFDVENLLATLFADDKTISTQYQLAAKRRKAAINRYLWNEEHHFFFDWHTKNQSNTSIWSLAAAVPLFTALATNAQAQSVSQHLNKFMAPGGLVTTLTTTSQQWDSPNGWAPLQWFAIKGLDHYGYKTQAREIATRWVNCVDTYFNAHHAILEKYDVMRPGTAAGGGEYDVQLGFGWTNGIYLKCREFIGESG
ncbi:alpha,alpha-trehalase TreF [Alteromonas sp. H39]|uniref:alpha,alpha-trehalase TreF n=1 Tax=Alteromonas sp. H39 TaxID=3389876 RepID=UPI0039E1E9C3